MKRDYEQELKKINSVLNKLLKTQTENSVENDKKLKIKKTQKQYYKKNKNKIKRRQKEYRQKQQLQKQQLQKQQLQKQTSTKPSIKFPCLMCENILSKNKAYYLLNRDERMCATKCKTKWNKLSDLEKDIKLQQQREYLAQNGINKFEI